MQLNMHNLYDESGNVKTELTSWLSGQKQLRALLPNLHLLAQNLNAHAPVTIFEEAQSGLYFSFLGSGRINTANDIQSVQVCYLAKHAHGQLQLEKGDERSLLQVYVSASHLAAALGETEEQIIQYFNHLGKSLGDQQSIIDVPLTDKIAQLVTPALLHQGHSISLAGHLYALLFSLIEQLQMLSHLSQCEECQHKLFHAQNLLETPDYGPLNLAELAQQVGLNSSALVIGFYHIVGQSIESYYTNHRIQFAAHQLRQNPTAKNEIVAQSGFSEAQFEAVFLKQFGVSSHQYEQTH